MEIPNGKFSNYGKLQGATERNGKFQLPLNNKIRVSYTNEHCIGVALIPSDTV